MSEFKSSSSYQEFAQSVTFRSRHAFDADTKAFLDSVSATSGSRMGTLRSGAIFWRAQLGYDGAADDPNPLNAARMKPLANASREGRVNPKGIPCLYLATNGHAAMAEVKPWIGSYVSLGQFRTTQPLKVVDLSKDFGPPDWEPGQELPAPSREKDVWGAMAWAFSEPVSSSELTADYAPTQILAEFFKSNGCDGIVYRSFLAQGKTVALFDLGSAELLDCGLFQTHDIFFKFKSADRRYFLSEMGPR
jgi:hypothetical protein